ncbi:hypothetical protein MPDQ_002020 [Monascus purpureus]|uniref:Uncharacterized protein n=1 Tax=Monascus purpureus TaxID=5098 RepID=A0A507R478_MONPU|nr:hypothetical protein MPDQ_002020 [Monascus purpureus]BDD56327.1 hypothetical protein MAP00_001797 [Monascus purpureus]
MRHNPRTVYQDTTVALETGKEAFAKHTKHPAVASSGVSAVAIRLGFLPAQILRIVKPSRLDARERSTLKDPRLNQINTGDILRYPAFSQESSKPAQASASQQACSVGAHTYRRRHATQRSACATASSLAPTHTGTGDFLSSAVHWNVRNGS